MSVLVEPGLDERVELGDLLVEGQHPLAMRAAMAAARVSPGRAVRWALAASTAVSASVTAFFTLRFFSQVPIRFSQVPIRLAPLRRIAASTW